MHDEYIGYVLSNEVSIGLAVLAFILVGLYILDLLLVNKGMKRLMRREGILLRLFNWAAFGFIFLLFGQVIELRSVETWRAAARMALSFLMISEAIFEIATLIPSIKRALWKKET